MKYVFHYTGATLEIWIMIVLSLKIKTGPLFNDILVKFTYLVGIIADQNFYDVYFMCFNLRLWLWQKAKVCQG